MSKSKIIPITNFQCESDRAAGQRFERMIALLDQLEDARQSQLRSQSHDSADRAVCDLTDMTMRDEVSDGDNLVSVIQPEEWDRAAVEREDIFRRRFGFAWPQPYRQALIDLKHKRRLSDREVWWLHHSGSLRRQENSVQFKASWVMAIIGCIAIAALMSQHALLALRIASMPVLTWTQSFVAVCLVAGVLAVQCGLYRTFIEPWRIYRRR